MYRGFVQRADVQDRENQGVWLPLAASAPIKDTEFILSMVLSQTWVPQGFGAHVQNLLAGAALHSSERSVISQ